MVVAAHPDDELLGLGATMHRMVNEFGALVHVVILGEGITSRSETRDTAKWQGELEIHRKNVNAAHGCIGFQSTAIYDFPDNRFDTVALLDIVKVIEKEKKAFGPEVIFTHHGGDVNIDHQRTFEAVITSSRPMKDEQVKTIICFETPSGTEWRAPSDPRHFLPNMYVSVKAEDLKAKIDGMECYEFERRSFPHPRSPQALTILAQRNGIIIGSDYAEAFCIVRSLN